MFSLAELLNHNDITIQCHNYPDADALATAFAVHVFLKENGIKSKIVYSGHAPITKLSILKMIELLDIPVKHVNNPYEVGTLITVDCQYGQGNVTQLGAKVIYQIDHHEDCDNRHSGVVRSELGSCSTLVWDLLKEGHKKGHFQCFSFEKHPSVVTALYYGLYTDTSAFGEIFHSLDWDMRDALDELKFDRTIFDELRFNNLSIEELSIAGKALTRYTIDEHNKFAIFQAEACDPNILGFISDLALQVQGVDVCIVYSTLPNGYKLSIRSCTREVMAGEFAEKIAFGNGRKQKAGGFISLDKTGGYSINEYIWNQTRSYFGSYDTIYSDKHDLDIPAMKKYKKRIITLGCVESTKIFPSDTPTTITIRTLEGDSDVVVSENILLMIGFKGEIYPIKSDKFDKSYTITSEKFTQSYTFTDLESNKGYPYLPKVKNKINGKIVELIELIEKAKSCIPTGETFIYAKRLEKNTKVFNSWIPDGYMAGNVGDYIAVRDDDAADVYIIKRDIFTETYDEV